VTATVVERWLEFSKYQDGTTRAPLLGYLPHFLTCHIKLVNSPTEADSLVSLFINGSRHSTLPLALVPGSQVKLEGVRKVVSSRGNVYLQATSTTNFVLISCRLALDEEAKSTPKDSLTPKRKYYLFEDIGR